MIFLLLACVHAKFELLHVRETSCPAIEERCLVRCEMAGAENRLRGQLFFHKEMVRCLDRCEEELCPRDIARQGEFTWTHASSSSRSSSQFAPLQAVGSGRGLVAVARPGFGIFVSWRRLAADAQGAAYAVLRRRVGSHTWTPLATVKTTSFVDHLWNASRSARTYEYKVRAVRGGLGGVDSRVGRVVASDVGRDFVELVTAEASASVVSNAMFADTDGDGELEAVCWKKSAMNGGLEKRYVLSIVELDGSGAHREFDNAMGRPVSPLNERGWIVVENKRGKALKEAPGSETSLWSRPRAAGDVDGDGAEEIWTTAVVDGVCRYVLLKDDGKQINMLASVTSPYPLCDGADNSRHDAFVANLDGDPTRLSLGIMGGRHAPWRIFMFDYDGTKIVPRWDVGSGMATQKVEGFASANDQTAHNVAVVDVDCDGRDELIAGATVIDDDGTILWDANSWFGKSAHVDGAVIDDVDPGSPGFEVVLFSETGPEYAVYRAATGFPLLEAVAPGFHVQWMIAVNASGKDEGLDVVGTYGGHFVDGGFAVSSNKTTDPYPFGDWPREAHNWYPIDWDGKGGRETAIYGFHQHPEDDGRAEHRPKIFGAHGVELFQVTGDGVVMRALANAIDIVGDHREEIVVQMADGSVRAYLNAEPLDPGVDAQRTKLEDYHYRRFLAHSTFPSHVAALGTTCANLDAFNETETVSFYEPSTDVESITCVPFDFSLPSRRQRLAHLKAKLRNPIKDRRRLRSKILSLRRELAIVRARMDVRRDLVNLTITDVRAIPFIVTRRSQPAPTTPSRPFEQECGRKRFGFCFGRGSKLGKLIRAEDARTSNRTQRKP